MAKVEKLKARLLTHPSDFSWKELLRLLSQLGYKETQSGKTSGSRVRFVHEQFEPIILHKPHPQLTLKLYQLRQIVEALKNRGQL